MCARRALGRFGGKADAGIGLVGVAVDHLNAFGEGVARNEME